MSALICYLHDGRWSCRDSNTERCTTDPSPERMARSLHHRPGTWVWATHILMQGRNLLGLVFEAELVLRQTDESSYDDETGPLLSSTLPLGYRRPLMCGSDWQSRFQ